MSEIVSTSKLPKLVQKLKRENKTTVLVGGCFDILHPGHVIFLEKAKKAGDLLIVILESDRKVKMLKGATRPIHSQKMRAKVLLALSTVDYVVMLPFIENDSDYDKLMLKIKPDIIATTKGDTNIHYLKRSARLVSAKIKFVTKKVKNYSSSNLLLNRY